MPGHWEGDLIIGKATRSAIGTLVERQTRYVLLFRLPDGRTAEAVRTALTSASCGCPMAPAPAHSPGIAAGDAGHLRFTVETGVTVYFCDPHSPWQRGQQREHQRPAPPVLPKGTDLSVHTQAELDAVARQLNGRPRQTLGWMKPSEAFARVLAGALTA